MTDTLKLKKNQYLTNVEIGILPSENYSAMGRGNHGDIFLHKGEL